MYCKYVACPLICLYACIKQTAKRLKRSGPIFYGTSHDLWGGLWLVRITKIAFKTLILQNPRKKVDKLS